MLLLRLLIVIAALLTGLAGEASAEGQQFNGTCTSIGWLANTETDLAGYRLYDRASTSQSTTLIRTYGAQVTSATCLSLGFNAGQHYLSIAAFDTSGNQSLATLEIAFFLILNNQVSDLRVTALGATNATLAFTEVNDGAGAPAKYDVRYALPSINWGTATSVSAGTCTTPVAGTTIGATKSCTITGLATTTSYEFQLVPYRGTLGLDAVFGPLSNIAAGATGGTPPVVSDRTVLASDTFARSNGALGVNWQGGYPSRGSAQIVSNAVQAPTFAAETLDTYVLSLPDDHWFEMTIPTLSASGGWQSANLVLRAGPPPSASRYLFALTKQTGADSTTLYGPSGLISQLTNTWSSGDVVRAEARGSTLTLYQNNTLVWTVVNAEVTSGSRAGFGIYVSGSAANVVVDSVSLGTFDAAASSDVCGCDQH